MVADDWTFAHLKREETLWGPHGYHRYPAKFIPQLVHRIIVICQIKRFLRNLADLNDGILRVCAVFDHPRVLQTSHLLCLLALLLVLSVLTLFAGMEYSKLEKIELGTTVHAPFNQFEPIHLSFQRFHYSKEARVPQGQRLDRAGCL